MLFSIVSFSISDSNNDCFSFCSMSPFVFFTFFATPTPPPAIPANPNIYAIAVTESVLPFFISVLAFDSGLIISVIKLSAIVFLWES